VNNTYYQMTLARNRRCLARPAAAHRAAAIRTAAAIRPAAALTAARPAPARPAAPTPNRTTPRIAMLTIGINYEGQGSELSGCINDSNNILAAAQSTFGNALTLVTQLTDHTSTAPTRANIIQALQDTVTAVNTQGYTHFVFHYSGHGTQVTDVSGDERDQKDEAIVPVDYDNNGIITDDWLFTNVLAALASHVTMIGIMDCCHSGSVFDLRFMYDPIGSGPRLRSKSGSRTGSLAASVIMISGCEDHTYSYDAWDAEFQASGAMTAAFIRATRGTVRKSNGRVVQRRVRPIGEIVAEMRSALRRDGYPQVPQISSSVRLTASSLLPAWSL
jgi:hypothetical protein